MRIRRLSIPEILIAICLISMFLPGREKSFIAITSATLIYSIYKIKCNINTIYTLYFLTIVLFTIYNFVMKGNYYLSYYIALIWLNPYFGVKLQIVNKNRRISSDLLELRHIYTLIACYIVQLVTTLMRVLDVGKFGVGFVFHNSMLALIGTLLAIELTRRFKSNITAIISMMLIALPILGALRQYVYIIIPILFMGFMSGRICKKYIFAIVILLSAYLVTPFGDVVKELYSDSSFKASSINQFLADASNPEESTFQVRMQWWLASSRETIKHRFLFGQVLSYSFAPFGKEVMPSGMLHSHFASAFADGGIILLLIIVIIYLKYLMYAIRTKDFYTALILYAYIITMGVNGWALTTQDSYVAFYLYGYYVSKLSSKNLKRKVPQLVLMQNYTIC